MHTSQQVKQRLSMMAFVLDAQVDAVVHPVADIQTVATVNQTFDDPPEEKPFKRQKTQVSSSTVPTINLTDSDVEEEEISPVPVLEEVDDQLQAFSNLFNGDVKKVSIPVSSILQYTSMPSSSSSALIISSIKSLSTLLVGATIPPSLSQLYLTATSTYAPMIPPSFQTPMLHFTTDETPIFKIPLHIPSFNLPS